LPACSSTQTAARENDANSSRYANNAVGQEATPPAEGPAEVNSPAEGPADVAANPAYIPTPLLRRSAAGGP
jgi:hypothetical protein